MVCKCACFQKPWMPEISGTGLCVHSLALIRSTCCYYCSTCWGLTAADTAHKHFKVHSLHVKRKPAGILFVHGGKQVRKYTTSNRHDVGQMSLANESRFRKTTHSPSGDSWTNLRTNLVLCCQQCSTLCTMWICTIGGCSKMGYERKTVWYRELTAEAEGWKTMVNKVEIGCRVFVRRSVLSLLSKLGIREAALKKAWKTWLTLQPAPVNGCGLEENRGKDG